MDAQLSPPFFIRSPRTPTPSRRGFRGLISGQTGLDIHVQTKVVGHRPSYGRGTKCVFLGFCCVDATQVMGVMGWGGGDGNVP